MNKLEEYYNKFNEDKRLLSRHGRVEFRVTKSFIDSYLFEGAKIADIGAGTGRYSIALAKEGYSVVAVEPVKYNLGILKKHVREELPFDADITAFQGNAQKLKRLNDNEFDLTLLLGPLYHLHSFEEKVKALCEAKRITKPGGHILVSYVMADYAIVKYGFMEGNIKKSIEEGKLTDRFDIVSDEEELYDYVRLEDIDEYNKAAGLRRQKIAAPDGASDYIRPYLNEMDDESFELFIKYQTINAERPELLGASSHLLDILICD